MAEQTILVCDVCGRPATGSMNYTVSGAGAGARAGQKYTKDLCDTHFAEVLANSRKPRRGRRRGSVSGASAAKSAAAPKRRGRPPKSASAGASATPRRRGRPRTAATAPAASAE